MIKEFNYSTTMFPELRIVITNKCIHCSNSNNITVDSDSYDKWRNGALIQHAFPKLDYKQREVIQTGIHPECWDEMFPQEDEDA